MLVGIVGEILIKYHSFGNNDLVKKLEKALSELRKIRTEETASLSPELFTDESTALNPQDMRQNPTGEALLSKINEDIRGVLYGVDVFRMMVLCLDYYNCLYKKRGDEEKLYSEISSLAERMSEYTYGIVYLDYEPDTQLKDALTRSQLKTLYYKITANR